MAATSTKPPYLMTLQTLLILFMLRKEAFIPSRVGCSVGLGDKRDIELTKKSICVEYGYAEKQICIVQLGHEVEAYWLTLVELVFLCFGFVWVVKFV